MPVSYFNDKTIQPQDRDIKIALGPVFAEFEKIVNHLVDRCPDFHSEWKYYGKKMGWQLKLFKGKRNILFIVPFERHFIVAFILGEKAVSQVMESELPEEIKTELKNAKKYMEGRIINSTINEDHKNIDPILRLIEIKIHN